MGFIPAKVAFCPQRNNMQMGIKLPPTRLSLEALLCPNGGIFRLCLALATFHHQARLCRYLGQPIHEYCHPTETF
jgi:hypothetical protein